MSARAFRMRGYLNDALHPREKQHKCQKWRKMLLRSLDFGPGEPGKATQMREMVKNVATALF